MDITVELQEPFSYALWPIIMLALIIVGIIVALIVLKLNKHPKKVKQEPVKEEPKVQKPVDGNYIKKKYLKQLYDVEESFRTQKISVRKAYQSMSIIVRKFVQEMTGIKVHSFTLSDIRKLNMPELESLIAEFYAPEFSTKSEGDVINALAKTRRIIEGWN